MASRPVFDGAYKSPKPELVLQDKVLDTAYDVVKEVLVHLQHIEALNSSIENINHLIPLLDSIELTGEAGLAGGGRLADNPVITLDLGTLPDQTDTIDPANDKLVILDASANDERLVTFAKLKVAVVSSLTALSGVAPDSLNLGSFTGSAVPANLTVKQAIQALSAFTESGFASRDSQVTARVNSAVDLALSDINALLTYLQQAVTDLNAVTGDLTGGNGSILTLLDSLQTASSALQAAVTDLQTTRTALQSQVDLLALTSAGLVADVGQLKTDRTGLRTDVDSILAYGASLQGEFGTLQTSVSSHDSLLSSHGEMLTSLSNALLATASAGMLEALQSWSLTTDENLSNQTLLIDALTALMEDKASNGDLWELTLRIADAEGAWDAAKDTLENLQDEISTIGSEIGTISGDEITKGFRDLANQLRAMATHAAFQVTVGHVERKEIISQQNTDRAAFTEEINVLVGDNAALAERTTTLEATTAATDAALTEIQAAYALADEALAAQITTLNSALAGKASATALNGLSAHVSDIDGQISSLSSAVTSVSSSVAGKADVSAVTALNTSVTNLDGKVTSVSQAMTEVMAGSTAGDVSTVRVRMAAQSAPSGVSARFGVEIKATAGGTFSQAGFYMDVLSGGTNRVAFQTSKFFIYEGGVTAVAPFIVSGSTVYMQNVYMDAAYVSGRLTAGQISVTSLDALSANLGSITVDTLHLQSNSVTNEYDASTAASLSLGAATETTIQTVSGVNLTNAYRVLVYAEFMNNDGAVGRYFDINVYDGATKVIDRQAILVADQGTLNAMTAISPTGSGSHTFTLKATCPGATAVKARRLVVLVFYR